MGANAETEFDDPRRAINAKRNLMVPYDECVLGGGFFECGE